MKPQKFRRLTRAEAKRLGVKYSAKRRVDASLKRVTSKTKLYSDRKVAELRTGVKREVRTKERRGEKGRHDIITFKSVEPRDYKRLISLAAGHNTQIIAKGTVLKHGRGSNLPDMGAGWRVSNVIGRDQLKNYLIEDKFQFLGLEDGVAYKVNVLIYPIEHI